MDLSMTGARKVQSAIAPHSGTITATFPPTAGDVPTELVIDNPKMEISPGQTHSTWSGTPAWDSTDGADNSHAGEFDISTGGIRYSWANIPNIADYDFVEVAYTASGVNSIVIKHYDSQVNYDCTGSVTTGTGTLKFILRQATSNGFAIQKYAAGSENMKITITKLTFTKGTRYNVTLNADGGTVSPTSLGVLLTAPVGTLPTPTQSGQTFMGWYLGETAVNATTVVTESFSGATLTAHWQPAVAASQITVDFTDMTFRSINTTITNKTATSYDYESSQGYNWALATFKVTLATGVVLSNYETVTFTFTGISGDTGHKDLMLLNASGITAGNFNADDFLLTGKVGTSKDATESLAGVPMTLTIDPSATLSGEIEIAIYGGMGSGVKYTISNVVFHPKP
jgi:uncharacterized repeat protein (TIGR02543 family)